MRLQFWVNKSLLRRWRHLIISYNKLKRRIFNSQTIISNRSILIVLLYGLQYLLSHLLYQILLPPPHLGLPNLRDTVNLLQPQQKSVHLQFCIEFVFARSYDFVVIHWLFAAVPVPEEVDEAGSGVVAEVEQVSDFSEEEQGLVVAV